MNKVITINLNGNAYQLEESGYGILCAYLDTAARSLAGNPDKDEIIADIEQAIGDKFRSSLGPYKTVVATKEVERVIGEMGAVDPGSCGAGVPDGEPARPTAGASAGTPPDGRAAGGAWTAGGYPAKRLYRIQDGAMLGGVCNGLATYMGIDVTIVRVCLVVLTLTYGVGIGVYVILALVLPVAQTPDQKAAAYDLPKTAQEFIRRAKEGYYEGMKTLHNKEAHREWKRKFKQEIRSWKQNWHGHWASGRYAPPPMGSPPPSPWIVPGVLLPILSLISAVIGIFWVVAVVLVLVTGSVAGVSVPAGMPVWVAILLLIVCFQILVWPLKAARRALRYGACYHPGWRSPWVDFGDFLAGVAVLMVMLWFANHYIPQVHQALQHLPPAVRGSPL